PRSGEPTCSRAPARGPDAHPRALDAVRAPIVDGTLDAGGDGMRRDEALALMHEYTPSEALRKHMYAVEAAMRAWAGRAGEDAETWGVVGLLHAFAYGKYPNEGRSPTEEHPSHGVGVLRQKGVPEPMLKAILGHASYTGVARETAMAKTLFAVDEL